MRRKLTCRHQAGVFRRENTIDNRIAAKMIAAQKLFDPKCQHRTPSKGHNLCTSQYLKFANCACNTFFSAVGSRIVSLKDAIQ